MMHASHQVLVCTPSALHILIFADGAEFDMHDLINTSNAMLRVASVLLHMQRSWDR